MKIVEICEAIDQKEADELLKSLVAASDPAAKYFQQTRYDPRHTTIDSAQRAAERMWNAEQRRKERQTQAPKSADAPKAQIKIDKEIERPAKKEREPADWGDRFYGNQHTGSLGRSASLGDVDLNIDFDQKGLKTIGKTIGAVKAASKPFSNLATAFKAGMNKAPSKR
jgi:hypothetical protein